MVLHEVMHLIAMEVNGIPAMTIFLVLVGGAMPVFGHEEEYQKLSWEKQAIVVLVGVIGNFILILTALILSQTSYLSFNDFLRIANLNGSLILWNLFPLWVWDGGRFAKLLFNSISEDEDTKYEILLLVSFGAVVMVLIILGKLSFAHLWLFSWGLHWQSTHDEPYASEDPRAIPKNHWNRWVIFYLAMISAGAIILGMTPNWL